MMTSESRRGAPAWMTAAGGTWSHLILLAVMALGATGCDRTGPSRRELVDHFTGATMGTSYSVRLGAPVPNLEAAALQSAIVAMLDHIDSRMSTWREDSDVSRFNASRSTDWFPVSPGVATVVAEAQDLSHRTGGALDVTVATLVALWGFASDDRAPDQGPSEEHLAEARRHTGYRKLEVRLAPPALRKRDAPDLQIDLSAIAKGYAVDVVAELIEEFEIHSYLVEIGGEVRVGDPKPDGSPWRIGIEAPVEGRRAMNRVVELTNTALATSGNYRNFYQRNGRRFAHLIDPRSGEPVPDLGLGSVSVLAPTCQEADALATALFVLGPKEGPDYAEGRRLDTLFLIRHEDGFSARMTGSFEQLAPASE